MTIRQDMIEIFNCPVLALNEDNLRKLELDPNDKTEIERRFQALQQLLRVGSTGTSNPNKLSQATISNINTDNMVRVGEAISSNTLKPSAVNGNNRRLARDFGVVKQWMGLGDEYTEQGWVRESISRIQRLWRGGMRETLQRMGVNETFRRAYEPLVARMRALGLRTDQIDRITSNAVELGFYPFLQNAQSLAPRGRQIMIGKYNTYIEEMRALGLPQQMIDDVLSAGNEVAQTNHRILQAIQDAGINVAETPMFGYLPRIMSEEASMRFNWKWRDEHSITWNDGTDSAITEGFLKGRNTSEFIVEDEVLLDFLLRNLGKQDHDDPLYYYKLVDENASTIGDVLDNRYGLAQVVKEMLERNHSNVVEALIDSNLLSKVDFTTVEIFDYIRETLNFPFDNLREVFATDWRTAMRTYQTQLEEVAAQTGFVNLLVKEATSGTWGITALQRASNPDYSNWVPLRGVLDPRILNKTFQNNNPVLGDIYVHPVAAELAVAAQKLQMSPQHMGSLARAFASINSTFRKLALATIEYLPRQFWQVAISNAAAGGSIINLPIYVSKMIMYEISSHFPNIGNPSRLFDNTKPAVRTADGKVLTEWEAFQWGLSTGILTRFDPVGGQVSPGKYNSLPVRDSLRYLGHTLTEQGIPRTIEEATTALTRVIDRAYYPLAIGNNIMNNAAAFNTLMSVTKRQTAFDEAIRIGSSLSALSVKSFDTLDEAFEHARNYFFLYDDYTYLDEGIRTFVIPFWGYLGKAIPAAVRYAIRHPSRFYAHQQLYALANAPVQDDEWLNEGSVQEWMLHSNPVYFRVPGLRDDGRDSYFVIPFESLDPFNSALTWAEQPAQAVLERFGIWNEHIVRTTRERVDSSRTNTLLNQMLEETFPIWKAAASEIRGEDLLGRPLQEEGRVNEYLGLRMEPRTAMWIETLLPIVGSVNRLNPGNVFGTPSRYDPFKQEWTLGEPSWAGVPRSSRDNFQTNNPYAALRYAGIKVYPVDVYLNSGHTYDSLSIAIGEMDKLLSAMETDLIRLPEELRGQREREIAELQYIREQTLEDMKKFGDFMKREGLNPRAAYDTLRQQNLRIGDLEGENDD